MVEKKRPNHKPTPAPPACALPDQTTAFMMMEDEEPFRRAVLVLQHFDVAIWQGYTCTRWLQDQCVDAHVWALVIAEAVDALPPVEAATKAAEALLWGLAHQDAATQDASLEACLPWLAALPALQWERLRQQLKAAVPRWRLTMLAEACQAARRAARAAAHPEAARPDAPDGWRAELLYSGRTPKECLSNHVRILEHLAPYATDCWFDVLRDVPTIGTTALSAATVRRAALAISAAVQMPIRQLPLVRDALTLLCERTPRDRLREWLDALPAWDETPRLHRWLVTHAGAADTPYVCDTGRLWVVSMVARARVPGCQCRQVLILEGAEEAGKTELCKTLAGPDWYREVSSSLEGKEGHMLLKGRWLIELSEWSSMSKTSEGRLKAFISMTNDEFIPKYANDPVTLARRAILVATVNPEADGRYLRSQTGNTRLFPVAVGTIALDQVKADRDQLFAEALLWYAAHRTDWWRLSAEGEKGALAAREERRQPGVYEDALANWLEVHDHHIVWWELLASEFLHLPPERWAMDRGRRIQMEIAKSLKALGWLKAPRRRHTYQKRERPIHPWLRPLVPPS